MANVLFGLGRQYIGNAAINLDTADIRVMLVKDTYTFDDTDEFLADMGAVDNGRTTALQNTTNTLGVFDADDITLTATAAAASNALVLFVHTGADATAKLIAYIDTATGLPVTPGAGGTVSITWSSGANKIFKL